MIDTYLQGCIVFAARYAYNRNTGAAQIVVSSIIRNWEELSPDTKEQLKREASDALYNKEYWLKVLDK